MAESVPVDFDWLIVGLLSIVSMTAAFVVLYYWMQFKKKYKDKKSKSYIIDKRFPTLVTFINLSVTAYLFSTPFMYITALSPLLKTDLQLYKWIARVANITAQIFWWQTIWCILVRFWLIYYELNYSNSLMNKQWLAHLDPSLISKDFWLKYKTTFGSQKYVTRISILICLIWLLPTMILKNIKIIECVDADCLLYWSAISGILN
eukprot:550146_1